MKNARLFLCLFVVLLSACSAESDDRFSETTRNDSRSVQRLLGTWVADSLRYREENGGTVWTNWENTEPDTITFSADSAYFGFTDKEEISGSYPYRRKENKLIFDEVGLDWKISPEGGLFLQFSSLQETDQYLYHKIE